MRGRTGRRGLPVLILRRKEDEYEYEFVDSAEKMDSGIDWDSGVGWNVVGVPAGKTFHQSACK
jgi:hypothetical protein